MPVPGPAALGRGVVILTGGAIPAPWITASVVTIDDDVLRRPADTVDRLHRHWAEREPVVIELDVDPARFRTPQSITDDPWRLGPNAEPFFDRLHHLVWANTYDARRPGAPIWWWARKAERLGATDTPDGAADLLLPDGSTAWVDGGPRSPIDPTDLDGAALLHTETVDLGALRPDPPPTAPTADLAADQLGAVAHRSGPARVIAPAGSGKTRVLTERLRHLIGDRGWQTDSVLAVAYNKEAQLELERRTAAFGPRVRTLNSLGLWVLREHQGSLPTVVDERDCRRLVDSLLPGRRRRANTDPIGPYLEALGAIRLGLQDPADVEAERDDVEGLADLFEPYRRRLADRGAVDFDEQIYRAIEVLLQDGEFRRHMQSRCRHLLVDEFQDLTPAHLLLIRLLALPNLDVFGVGDDDQVIYGHNSASPAFLIDYEQLFPTAASHPLTINYRCPKLVVEAARNLLGYNNRRVDKTIDAGPDADPAPDGLRIVDHGPDDAAGALVDQVRAWLDEPGVEPNSIAVLSRVNSLLLAPQIALADAGLPISSVLRPDILTRTGLRAALAYLRLATSDERMQPADIVEILRRPTRGLPQWFPDRLDRRPTWTISQLRRLADQVPDKEAAKVMRLADDLAAVLAAARTGTTRDILEVVRDEVGLGSAMGLLDHTGGGGAQGSSHLDDLEGLLGVADLHPEPTGFESWLRGLFAREADPDGITLSTIHRVKGREWDRVAVFGVMAGVLPHRLSEDPEEERRVLHVAITRGRHRVTVLADRSRRSPFLAELAGTAPKRRPAAPTEPAKDRGRAKVSPLFKKSGGSARTQAPDGHPAEQGARIRASGGHDGTIEDADGAAVVIRLDGGGSLRVRYGERVEIDGRRQPLTAPVELWGPAARAEQVLRSWRTDEARSSGKPAFTVLSDAHLRGIALTRPTTAAELAACDGIGPTKLERWGDQILAVLDQAD